MIGGNDDSVVMIDTSAWIEFLRDGDPAVSATVEHLVGGKAVTCDVVVMEVLAGASDDRHLAALERLLARAIRETVQSVDFEFASVLYRTARRRGVTVRSHMDCLVAAVAMRAGVPVLHYDRDFDALASCTELRVQRPMA